MRRDLKGLVLRGEEPDRVVTECEGLGEGIWALRKGWMLTCLHTAFTHFRFPRLPAFAAMARRRARSGSRGGGVGDMMMTRCG